MRQPAKALLFSVSFGISAALKQACPLNAPQYLIPDSLSTEPEFQAAAKQFDSTIDEYVKKGLYEGLTFSAGVFSTTSEDLLWQYHHASPGLKNSTQGGKDVDADSIYRIGSISKMLTMYLLLIKDGDRSFNEPITKYLPALTEYASQSSQLVSPWDEVTIGDLAGQMAGLSRDCKLSRHHDQHPSNFSLDGLGDLAVPANSLLGVPPAIAKAFPQLPDDEIPICNYVLADGTLEVCTEDGKLGCCEHSSCSIADNQNGRIPKRSCYGNTNEFGVWDTADPHSICRKRQSSTLRTHLSTATKPSPSLALPSRISLVSRSRRKYLPEQNFSRPKTFGTPTDRLSCVVKSIFNQSLVEALSLPGTYYTTPSAVTSHDVIPGDIKATGWAGEFGPFAPRVVLLKSLFHGHANISQSWCFLLVNKRFQGYWTSHP